MPRSADIIGFGRGGGNLDRDIAESEQEVFEEQEWFSRGVEQFSEAFFKNRDGDYVNWSQVISSVEPEYLADEKFLRYIIQEYRNEYDMHELFSILPVGIQEDIVYQKIFFSLPHFDIRALKHEVLVRCDKDLVFKYWSARGRYTKFEGFPWDLFSPEEKRKHLKYFFDEGISSTYDFKKLVEDQKSFQDTFSPEEWKQLLRDLYEKKDWLLEGILKSDYELLKKTFTDGEIRDLIEYGKTRNGEHLLLTM